MIIMLTGKAGCGKDTAYKIMEKYATKEITRLAFADYLKDIAYFAGWNGVKDEKGRKFLVSLGKAINEYQNNFFAKTLADGINRVPTMPDNKVITDLRFPREYHTVAKMLPHERIVLIKIFGRASEYGRTTNDVSERDINEDDIGRCFDFIVDNSGSYLEFENNLKYIVGELNL